MKLNWDLLLNDDAQFPRTFFFEDAASQRFRYGINEQLQYCLYLHLPSSLINEPMEPVVLANVSLVEEVKDRQNTLVLTLLNENCKNLFGDLIVSIVTQASILEDKNVKRGFIALCNEWFDLFDASLSKLSREDVQGIFAELIFLRHLLVHSMLPYNEIVLSWTGPYGKGHDFEIADNHFEVKGIADHKHTVQVSSEYQLDFMRGQKLLLVIYSFTSSLATTGSPLSELVMEIAGLLRNKTGPGIKAFWTALRKIGVNNNNLREYDHYLFTVTGRRYFDCTSFDFPSIRRSSIPDAISNVKYQLAITDLAPHEENDLSRYL